MMAHDNILLARNWTITLPKALGSWDASDVSGLGCLAFGVQKRDDDSFLPLRLHNALSHDLAYL
jgi:hypothetical protein